MTVLQQEFRQLATAFLDSHPEVPHEWRDVPSRWWGDRIDLVCGVGSANEVFASLHAGGQITVGTVGGEDDDFEDFGRGLSDQAVAQEAFERLVAVLLAEGYLKSDAE